MTADRENVRRLLITAAHTILAREGSHALTVRRITEEAGVTTMNLYSRFGGKDGILEALFIDGFERLRADLDEEVLDDPIADLRRRQTRYRRFALDNPTDYSLMFEGVVPEFEPGTRGRAVAREALEALAHAVQRAIDAGAIAVPDAWSVAVGLWATCHGLVRLELRQGNLAKGSLQRPSSGDPSSTWEALFEQTVDRLLLGYMRPSSDIDAERASAPAPRRRSNKKS